MSNVRPMIRQLAQQTASLAVQTQNQINEIVKSVNTQANIVAAIAKIVGEDKIQEAIIQLKKEEHEKEQAQKDEARKALVEKGALVPATEITPTCIFVGSDSHPDGTKRIIQTEAARLAPDALARFVGKKVGDTVEGNGVVFTVTEIYSIDMEKMKGLIEAEQAKATPAPAAAPVEVAEETEKPKKTKKNPRVK